MFRVRGSDFVLCYMHFVSGFRVGFTCLLMPACSHFWPVLWGWGFGNPVEIPKSWGIAQFPPRAAVLRGSVCQKVMIFLLGLEDRVVWGIYAAVLDILGPEGPIFGKDLSFWDCCICFLCDPVF